MLKQRILTAVVLAPLVLCGVFLLGLEGFAVFFAIVTLIGAWEWGRLSGFTDNSSRIAYSAVVAAALGIAWWLNAQGWAVLLLAPALIFWCLGFFWIAKYPSTKHWSPVLTRAAIGVLFLVAAWLSLLQIKAYEHGNAWLLLMLLVVWAADIGAYFSGKRWGSVKLAPAVSPGKTREGLYGGLVAVVFTSLVFSLWNELSILETVYLAMMCFIVGAVSVMGDLLESMLKRHAGIKDSGSILPGHGGVLDRVDSILAAAPFFYMGLFFLPSM